MYAETRDGHGNLICGRVIDPAPETPVQDKPETIKRKPVRKTTKD